MNKWNSKVNLIKNSCDENLLKFHEGLCLLEKARKYEAAIA